jgi:hypothetical protein
VCLHLARAGWLEGKGDSTNLSDHAGGEEAMDVLQMLPADADALQGDAGQLGGFSLHAGVAAQAHEGDKLERLCRQITRPAIAENRLSISPQGRVRYQRGRENARRGGSAGHETRHQPIAPRRMRRLRALRLPGRLPEKGA